MELKHLGIIADGNRRWARGQGLPTIEGHKKGLERIEMLIGAAMQSGISYITFYVFSTENWGRSEEEVDGIMNLVGMQIVKLAKKMAKNNVKMVVLGGKERVDSGLMSKIEEGERLTAKCTGITACFCFNYGGEQEIADAAKKVVEAGEEITPLSIRANLYHPEIPNVDMVVRTSGEKRMSGFMLWRSAYAELLFLDKYFPEIEAEDLKEILREYEKRHRRFGK